MRIWIFFICLVEFQNVASYLAYEKNTNSHPTGDYGADLGCFNEDTYSPEVCQQKCTGDPTCLGVFVYHADHSSVGRCCYKSSWTGMGQSASGDFYQPCLDGWTADVAGVCFECPQGKYGHPDECKACPNGYIQPYAGQVFCIGCLVGEYQTGDQCISCPRGYFQPIATSPLMACTSCPIGYFQNEENGAYCQGCSPGKYQSGTGQSNCETCLQGSFSDQPHSLACQECPIGFYQDPEIGHSRCIVCERGNTTVTPGQIKCQSCSPENCNQCDGYGGSNCDECAPGQYSLNSDLCQLCPDGYISGTYHDSCSVCEFGTIVAANGSLCDNCPLGWSGHGSTVPYTCKACDVGKYRDDSIDNCQDCPSGFFSGGSTANCEGCAAGKYKSIPGSASCNDCASDKVSGPGWILCLSNCLSGFSPPWTDPPEKACLYCPAGREGTTAETCQFCQLGYYKEYIWQNCLACPAGQISTADRVTCTYCEAGKYAVGTTCTDCLPGKYMPVVSTIEGQSEYVPPLSCISCQPGKFQDHSRKVECKSCPVGKFSQVENSVTCTFCPNGWTEQHEGSFACEVCPIGYYDFWNALVSHGPHTVCEKCDPVSVSELVCENGIQAQCLIGQYFKAGNGSSSGPDQHAYCEPCPLGTYGTLSGGEVICTDCPAAKYGDREGSYHEHMCGDCPTGSVTNLFGSGSSFCIQCSADEVCQECSAGTYFSLSTCVQCAIGQISDVGASTCTHCPPGSIEIERKTCEQCPNGRTPSDETCIDCLAGFYGENGYCTNCPLGQFADAPAATTCKACPELSTTNFVGADAASDCQLCPEQFSLVADGICSTCPPGKFTLDDNCQNCAAGTYRTASQDECEPCASGRTSMPGTPCQDCSAGFYTDEPGSPLCRLCDGVSSASTCSSCSAGRFGTPIPTSAACKECPEGYWSVSDSEECFGCDIGTFQPLPVQEACQDCAPGTFSDIIAQTVCKNCPVGEFGGTSRSGACLPCQIGRYQDQPGSEECIKCTDGKYTQQVSSESVLDCIDCPAGTFELDGQCLSCPEKTYQDQTGQTICKSCTPGHLSPRRSTEQSQCFAIAGLTSYVFGMKGDSKEGQYYDKNCEIRPNLVMLCPGCSCDDDSRNGYWSGPICSECRRGFATTSCTAKCPAYDGTHDSTMCNGNGFCWFGKFGNGLCYCGSKHDIDSTGDNVVVDVRLCPKGQICPNYGLEKQEETNYRPIYYIMRYRQYSVFVLQLNKYTPERGHMWFKRFPPSIAYENTCLACVSTFSQDISTKVGFWNKEGDYENFGDSQQAVTGFHGENCQYECGLCLNGGRCSHVPHPYRYSYTIHDTFNPNCGSENLECTVFIPQTLCICSSLVYDPENMCCPHGFQPYIHYGLRLVPDPYTRFSALPYITSIENKKKRHWINKDILLEPGAQYKTSYSEPDSGLLWVANNNRQWSSLTDDFVQVPYKVAGPYNKHVFYGVPREMCRACPGLFGKGVRAASSLISTEEAAEEYWWDNAMGASPRKCNGIGVCDFYAKNNQRITDFFGDANNYEMYERGRSCSDIPVGGLKQYNNLQDCINYAKQENAPWMSFSQAYKGGTDQNMHKDLDGNVIYSNNRLVAEESARNLNSKGYASSILNGREVWTVLTPSEFTMPLPDSDSNYTMFTTSTYTCGAYMTCDSYVQVPRFNLYKLELGRGSDRMETATFDRFDTCFTYTKDQNIQTYGLYVTQDYSQGQDPFLGGLCPKGHFCTVHEKVAHKEACPVGYYQSEQGRTRSVQSNKCSEMSSAAAGCQLNEATLNPNDFVDIVCIRCPRNHWSAEGSPICTQCPNGKLKKITGVFDVTTPMINIPTMNVQGYAPWYYIENDMGTEISDCAIVPAGLVHIPNLNLYMTYERPDFLAVAACPFGFSSRPSTFIFEGFDDLTSLIVSSDEAVIEAPYVQYDKTYRFIQTTHGTTCTCQDYLPLDRTQCLQALTNVGIQTMVDRLGPVGCFVNSLRTGIGYFGTGGTELAVGSIKYFCRAGQENNDLAGQFVRANCFRCPGNSVTGPSSTTCTTCFANQMKVYTKEGIQKIAETATTRIKEVGGTKSIEYRSKVYNFDLTYEASSRWPVLKTFEHYRQGGTEEFSLSDCYLACQSMAIANPLDLTAVGISKPTQNKCVCSVAQAEWAPTSDPTYLWYRVSGENVEDWLESALPLCAACQPGKYTTVGCQPCDVGRYTETPQQADKLECIKCEPGRFAAQKSSKTCTKCPIGYVQAFPQSSSCNACAAGLFIDITEQISCKSCSAGKYSGTAASGCIDCAVGTFAAQPGSPSCQNCAVGHYQDEKAKTACIACPAGYKHFSSLRCEECMEGKYQTGTAQTGCTNCLVGTYSNSRARTTSCVACSSGTYQTQTGMRFCLDCPGGKTCSSSSAGSNCDTGKYIPPRTHTSNCWECDAEKTSSSTRTGCEWCTSGKTTKGVGGATCSTCPAEQSWHTGLANGHVPEHSTKTWKTWVIAPADASYTFKIYYVDDVTTMQFRFRYGGDAGRIRKTYTQTQTINWSMKKGQIGSVEVTCQNYGGPSRCAWYMDERLYVYPDEPGSQYCAMENWYKE